MLVAAFALQLQAQTQDIDLKAYFQRKYVTESVPGLAWQPNSNNYSYIDKDKNLVLVNAQSGKETTFLSKEALSDNGIKTLGS